MGTIIENFSVGHVRPEDISPVALAYMGDTLFDLYIRTKLVAENKLNPHAMHQKASSYANAGAQAKMAQRLLYVLSDEETQVLKHSRNQKSISVPKNASPVDYKWATGFETLLGWLYFNKQDERLVELMDLALESVKEEKKDE